MTSGFIVVIMAAEAMHLWQPLSSLQLLPHSFALLCHLWHQSVISPSQWKPVFETGLYSSRGWLFIFICGTDFLLNLKGNVQRMSNTYNPRSLCWNKDFSMLREQSIEKGKEDTVASARRQASMCSSVLSSQAHQANLPEHPARAVSSNLD